MMTHVHFGHVLPLQQVQCIGAIGPKPSPQVLLYISHGESIIIIIIIIITFFFLTLRAWSFTGVPFSHFA